MLDSLEVAKLETLWQKRRKKIFLKNSAIVLCAICFLAAIFYASFGTSTATSTQIAQKSAKSLENSENSNASKTDEKAEFSEFSEVLENSNNILENSNNISKTLSSSENSSNPENSISIEEMREQLKEEIKAEITQETIEREELQKEQERQLAQLKQKARKELELERMNKVANEIDVGGYFAPNPNYPQNYQQNYPQNPNYQANPNYQQNYPQNYAPNQMPNQAPNQYNGQNQYGGQNQNYAPAQNAQKPNKGVVKISSSPAKPKTNNDNLEEIEENYKIHKEAKDALALALNYYEKADFDKAAKWAYELNSVDKNNPQGWILFAKSKYKSGNKADAIKVLEAYKQKASNQKEIQDLINQMKQNLSIK